MYWIYNIRRADMFSLDFFYGIVTGMIVMLILILILWKSKPDIIEKIMEGFGKSE